MGVDNDVVSVFIQSVVGFNNLDVAYVGAILLEGIVNILN
jgi:hypothetical protein